MTTLSKEDVVRAAFEKYFDHDDKGTHWHTFRDAYEIGKQAARADLVAENERLKAESRDACFGLSEHYEQKLTATRTALAAAEADNERLRKALDKILTTDWVSDRVRSTAKTALAQPRDDSALREMIAEVYEECKNTVDSAIKEYANSGWHGSKGYHMGLLKASEVAIRALAEKARGG